jgi:hypothetical protein
VPGTIRPSGKFINGMLKRERKIRLGFFRGAPVNEKEGLSLAA